MIIIIIIIIIITLLGLIIKIIKFSTRFSTYSDITSYLQQEKEIFPMNLICIPWNERIKGILEFRCFIHRKKLCAISQYDFVSSSSYFKDLSKVFEIKNAIENFHEQYKNFIPYLSYVMDVFVDPLFDDWNNNWEKEDEEIEDERDFYSLNDKGKYFRVYLIEFNPFYADCGSGSSLFEWQNDFSMMYNGVNGNPIMRIRDPTRYSRPKIPFVVDFC